MKLRIKEVCKAKETSITELAQRMDIKQESLSRTINGNPTLSTLENIAKALGVEVTDLFEKTAGDFKCPNCGAALNINVELAKRKE